MEVSKRTFLTAGGLAIAGSIGYSLLRGGPAKAAKKYPFTLSDAEWRKRLPTKAYRVLRKAETELAFSSPLDLEYRQGSYVCAGCSNRLFSSSDKYDSKSGWPSFTKPLKGAIGTSTDYKIGYPRTEVHCSRCGGHLGHVFNDGPAPTGKRWCMNGVAMRFIPA